MKWIESCSYTFCKNDLVKVRGNILGYPFDRKPVWCYPLHVFLNCLRSQKSKQILYKKINVKMFFLLYLHFFLSCFCFLDPFRLRFFSVKKEYFYHRHYRQSKPNFELHLWIFTISGVHNECTQFSCSVSPIHYGSSADCGKDTYYYSLFLLAFLCWSVSEQ